MAVNVRIDLDLGETADAHDRPTVADVRRWLATVDANTVSENEPLMMERGAGGEVVGFYVWGTPND